MTAYFVRNEEFVRLPDRTREYALFAPQSTASGLPWLAPLEPDATIDPDALLCPRAAQSPKALYMPAAESVGQYGTAEGGTAVATRTRPVVLFGVRACELRARAYLDQVLLEGEFADPTYRERRNATTIVSCDCVDCAESCFCTLVGGQPYPTEAFDVNLSSVEGGWLVEVATDRGRDLLAGLDAPEATAEQLERREEARQLMTTRVNEQNKPFAPGGPPLADDTHQPPLPQGDDEAWQRFAADCVECAACTNVCPTCYCFYLYDQALGPEQFERVRTWDSCLLSTYHRMAGGVRMKLSPRPRLSSRLANRVLHKFAYAPEQVGRLGCVGCGRCIDACLGGIDLREVVSTLAREGTA